MSKEPSKPLDKLSSTQLLKFLRIKEKVCVVGFDLSREARAPHFDDILKGIWSTASCKLNPFLSEYGYQTVTNWFKWRIGIIEKFVTPGVFNNLAKFQETFHLKVVTQCVDGMVGLHGVQDVLEPYGNVLGRKCHECGNALAPQASDYGRNELWLPCEMCGGVLFPDVTMFGWNSKEECHQMVRSAIENAKALIIVGAAPALLPFYGSTGYVPSTCPVLEISPTGFSLQIQSSVFKATADEIAKEIFGPNDNRIKSANMLGFGQNLHFLSSINGYV